MSILDTDHLGFLQLRQSDCFAPLEDEMSGDARAASSSTC